MSHESLKHRLLKDRFQVAEICQGMLVLETRERERGLTQIKSIFLGEGKEYTLLIQQRVCMARSIGRLRYFGLSKKDAKCRRKAELKKQALVPKNRPISKICPVPALGGCALFLSFSLVFRTGAPSCKPRCLVYKAARAQTSKESIILMATLYYTACSGLIDEYAHVRRKAKPSKAIALKSGLQVMGSNTELHCAHKQKGKAFLERKTTTLCYPSRQMIFKSVLAG